MRRPAALLLKFCARARASEREITVFTFHVLENAQMTPSNVPNTAMLTGTARTSVGTRPRQKTRPPDSAYILCAMRHDEPRRPASMSVMSAPMPVIVPACKRVLRTSKGNVAIQPIIPAAAPATSGAAQGRAGCEIVSVSVSYTIGSGWSGWWWCRCAGAGAGAVRIGVGVGVKRRSVPSYYWRFFCTGFFRRAVGGKRRVMHAPRRSIVRIRLRLARWLRRAHGRVRGCHLCGRYVVQRLVRMPTQTQTWGMCCASLFRGWCEGVVDASAAGS